MKSTITRIMKVTDNEPKPPAAMMLKLVEEVGELAEAVNHQLGYLPNKKMKEPLMGEVADVIQCAIAVARRMHPDLTLPQLCTYLEEQLNKKTDKWENVIEKNGPQK